MRSKKAERRASKATKALQVGGPRPCKGGCGKTAPSSIGALAFFETCYFAAETCRIEGIEALAALAERRRKRELTLSRAAFLIRKSASGDAERIIAELRALAA